LAAPMAGEVDPDWKGLYRYGGVLLMISGILTFILIAMLSPLASALTSSDAALKNFAGQAQLAQVTLGLDALASLILVPPVLALYLALKGVNRNAMLVATVFQGIFIVLHLVITPTALSLITISQNYVAATSDAQRAAYVAAMNVAFATYNVGEVFVFSAAGIGLAITGFVMVKGIFGRAAGYLGLVAGILCMVQLFAFLVPALDVVTVLFVVLFGIWSVLVGFRLFRLGRR
jgi:hypothetical protein